MSEMERPAPAASGNGAAICVTQERPHIIATRTPAQAARAEITGNITLEQGKRISWLSCSYTRLPTIVGMFYRMEYSDWLAVLGDAWSCCDNISAHLSWLRVMLPRVGPVRPMMDEADQAAWDALPDRVRVYRGARHNQLGASWSLDRAIAAKFPHLMRYNFGGEPVLVTAEVRKCDILAIKLDRDESEAIVLRGRRILSREPIEERAAA